jgi:hypothetical protein
MAGVKIQGDHMPFWARKAACNHGVIARARTDVQHGVPGAHGARIERIAYARKGLPDGLRQ